MKKEILLSVIIPVYNVEKYLKRCLDSVINQEYKNIEIICVDDCSTDNSLSILEEYVKKDNRIKIIRNKKNLGLGRTRNNGLNYVQGNYVHFLDSDDYLKENAYCLVSKVISKFDDIDIYNFMYDTYDEKQNCYIQNKKIILESLCYKETSFIRDPVLSSYWEFPVWTKVIKTQFLKDNNLYFNANRCQEDIEFSMLLLLKAKSIILTKDVLLTYRENRKGSLVGDRCEYLSLFINDIKNLEKQIKDYSIDLKQKFLSPIYFHFIICASEAFYYNILSFKELKRLVKEIINFDFLEDNYIYNYQRILYNKIMKYNEFRFRLSYCSREFIKRNFSKWWRLYFKIKNFLKGGVWMRLQ